MTSIVDGHHRGCIRAETKTLSGFNSLNISNCRDQSGLPETIISALSVPMRRDSPPTKSAAVKVMSSLRIF